MPLSLPPLRFCLLCVAVLFAHRVDSFAPAPRCIRNPHVLRAAMPQQCSRLWRAARKSIAPAPIAPAPRNITSSVLFSPRFAAREALLGASVMAAYHPVLMLGSAAGRCLVGAVVGALFSAPTTLPRGAPDALDVGQSPIHVMDNVLKQWVYTIRRSPSGSSWADAPIVGPVAEELAYRGFYQWLAHYCLRLRFGLACACGSFGPRAFRAYVAFTLLGALGMKTPDYREVVTRALGGFAAASRRPVINAVSALLFTTALATQLARTATALYVAHDHARQRTGAAGNRTTAASDRLAVSTASRLSRLESAGYFGRAHLFNARTPFQLALSLQKAAGTMASSLLFETRLAHVRRNVWAPIGAHIMFNSLSEVPIFKEILAPLHTLPTLQAARAFRLAGCPSELSAWWTWPRVAAVWLASFTIYRQLTAALSRLLSRLALSPALGSRK